ncbi:MAG: DUF2975 domain-containing protein [Pseudomonadota bacterium]
MKKLFNTGLRSEPPTQSTFQQSWLNKVLGGICGLLMLGLPATTLYAAFGTSSHTMLTNLGVAWAPANPIPEWQRGVSIVVSLIPVTCMSYGLFFARQIFLDFANNAYFNFKIVKSMRSFAAGVFTAAFSGLIVSPLIGVILTLQAPAGSHALALHVGSQELLGMLFGGIAWQIAHVMTKAVALAEENAQFV